MLDNGKAAEISVVWWRRKKARPISRKLREVPADGNVSKAVYADTEGFVSDGYPRWNGGCFHGWRSSSGHRDTIDYSVGFSDMARLGDSVDGQRPLAGDPRQRRSQLAGSGESGQSGN